MKMKSCLATGLLILVAAVAVAALPENIQQRKIFDEDGNRIFENLQDRMTRARGSERIPVLIRYRDETPLAGTYAVRLSGVLRNESVKYSYHNVPVVAVSLEAGQIRQALEDPMVEHIELDGVMHKTMVTASMATGVTAVRTQFGFDGDGDGKPRSYSSQDIVISIIDTGVQVTHPDLRGKVLYFKDFINGRKNPYDDEGHGTHVAGVAAGAGKANRKYAGVAPGAALVVFKVLGADGSGEVSNGIAAVDETISRKAEYNIRVLNLSLAVSGSSNGRDAFSLACNRAVDAGIVTVAAAGNDGAFARTIGTPSAAVKVITVGAGADPGEQGFFVADFSSRGPTADGRIKPDLWAPGLRLRSPQRTGGYSDVSGTSFAAPFVSGVVALMLDARPSLKPGGVKAILMGTAQRWAPGGKSNEFGFGRLQAYHAVTRAAGITEDLKPPNVPRVRFLRGNISAGQERYYRVNVASTKYPVAVTVVLLHYPSAIIDVEIQSSTGAVIARSFSFSRQKTLTFRPSSPGTYFVKLKEIQSKTAYLLDVSGDLL